jgi:acyl-CoA thioesterase FadM
MGVPYATILDERKVGFPTVRAEADFARGLAYGDVVNVSVDVLRVGRSSVTMRYRLRRNGENEVAMEARITTACVDLSTFAPMPIPDDLRRLFSDHLVR